MSLHNISPQINVYTQQMSDMPQQMNGMQHTQADSSAQQNYFVSAMLGHAPMTGMQAVTVASMPQHGVYR